MEQITITKPKNYKSHFTVEDGDKHVLVISFTDTEFQAQKELCPAFIDFEISETDDSITIKID